MDSRDFWRNLNLEENEIPPDVKQKSQSIDVTESTGVVDNVHVFYREAKPESLNHVSLLLLHGAAFSSKTWLDLGTIRLTAAMGYHTVAIDLPGYGNTPAVEISKRAEFLDHIIQHFKLDHPVIVSPSMSGYYSLLYLLKNGNKMAGYIPVAPVGIDVIEKLPAASEDYWSSSVYKPLQHLLYTPLPDLRNVKTPTMVVFGEKDRTRSSALLSLLPNSQCKEIPNGRHPAYLDDPDLWHKLLYNFLHYVGSSLK